MQPARSRSEKNPELSAGADEKAEIIWASLRLFVMQDYSLGL